MKEFVISEAKAESAILVGLITKDQDEAKTKEYLDELEFLADTAGAVTVKRYTQRVGGPSQTTYVGKGKLEEIRNYIKEREDAEEPVGMVIFDDELFDMFKFDHALYLDDEQLRKKVGSLYGICKPTFPHYCKRTNLRMPG